MAFSIDRGYMETASIRQWQDYVHSVAKSKGWWDKEPNVGEKLMLMVSELSEALEDYRSGKTEVYMEGQKPCGLPTELADTVIRILDFCGYYNIDLASVMVEKAAYNETRPYRHGGKAA